MNAVGTLNLDATLFALADPTRRAILQRVSEGELRVTALAEPFAMSLNAVSKHILVLEKAKLIKRRRIGREHLLSIDLAPLDEVTRWIEEQRGEWNKRFDRLDAILLEEER
jgi:DNA-binding transcriptional ArsR family regulator